MNKMHGQRYQEKCDSGEVKGCNQHGCPCTARLEGINCVTLQHSEGICLTTYQCLLDANSPDVTADSGKPTDFPARTYMYPSYTTPGTYHTVKLLYDVDNPDEVGSTAVYPPSGLDPCQLCAL